MDHDNINVVQGWTAHISGYMPFAKYNESQNRLLVTYSMTIYIYHICISRCTRYAKSVVANSTA